LVDVRGDGVGGVVTPNLDNDMLPRLISEPTVPVNIEAPLR
jgi:hypothetical protein